MCDWPIFFHTHYYIVLLVCSGNINSHSYSIFKVSEAVCRAMSNFSCPPNGMEQYIYGIYMVYIPYTIYVPGRLNCA